MSFFGFDTTLPRDRGHQGQAPGFGAPQDAFAGLSGRPPVDDDALDFEDTYDGLADKLDESGDAFNDDTFGGGPSTQKGVGKDFDFSGQTDNVARAIEEERMRFAAQRPATRIASPPKKAAKPARTGYESYIPQLEADASIWGVAPAKAPEQPSHNRQMSQGTAAAARRMMSLEEVEAEMRRQENLAAQAQQSTQLPGYNFPGQPQQHYEQPPQQLSYSHPPQILQRRPQSTQELPASQPKQAELPAHGVHQPQILQRPRQEAVPPRGPQNQNPHSQQGGSRDSPQPRQILQNPNRLSGPGQPLAPSTNMNRAPPTGPGHHNRGPSYNGPIITNPQQILNLSDEDRAMFLQEEARRAKRNHKIHLLSKHNGLMTPQDKNFITRIQLQQLVTATGSLDAQGPEAVLNEDFYYQVYAQIRGASRQNPHQPASQFAHTYLFQTGGRYGMRRGQRHGDSHLARMEQQVARAVEAAKAKPKNKQLVLEGSLGKISYSNAKTPKPLLNFKRPDTDRPVSRRPNDAAADRRATLKDIENVYITLMKLEDHERQIPPRLDDNSDPATIQKHMEWRDKSTTLNQKLWTDLKILEAIDPNSLVQHPFIAMLSHAKGKKAMPRVFRHLDEQQRLTTITMLFVSLDQLDVVHKALPSPSAPDAPIPLAIREEIELFSQTVMPALFGSVGEAPLSIIAGIIGVIVDRTNVPLISLTKIGLSILTMVLSRAEVLRESEPGNTEWGPLYNRLFDLIEPVLPHIFPGKVTEADDVHVWQFLAAMGVGASPEQQQRLVIGVKERVMETVRVSRTLPRELGEQRSGHVNLFMRAIGLDVELLNAS